ncbi:tRNA methyltransferase 10 B [Saguinus oedipus]|uniref:tRNA (guanine(9)-N(1))-methyltransferase n=1 Tax=Saguinus oedipus TaxID=9490 RepID=A0ABQ9WEY2_SAGOE|nr:tRNA methyltransferase 10 B [Saguinus oedipus]
MDWKLEGSTQKAESPVQQGQEAILEETGEDELPEGFQLLQIDAEGECQEGETLAAGSTACCSQTFPESFNQRKTFGSQTLRTKTMYRFEYEPPHVKEGRTSTKPGISALMREVQNGAAFTMNMANTSFWDSLRVTHVHMYSQFTGLSGGVFSELTELSRLAGQIRRLYGSNKKADRPFWICLTGFTTDSPIYEECLRMNDGFSSYLLDITEDDCFSLFPLETLVYLTPDSEHALEDVDLNKVYILGGLVDESIQKFCKDSSDLDEVSIDSTFLPAVCSLRG